MVSIKHRIALMIFLADGQTVRRCHALEAGVLVQDIKLNRAVKTNKRFEEGRRQEAEGRREPFWLGIQTPPNREPPNQRFGGGLKKKGRRQMAEGRRIKFGMEERLQVLNISFFPSAFCLLPSAFLLKPLLPPGRQQDRALAEVPSAL